MLISGDCTFIKTPTDKRILVDGGNNEYSVLLPYLLDRRVKRVDYILVSHFDSDHSNGLLEVIENLKVKNIIIAKQCEETVEFKNFMEIATNKNINIITAKSGDRISFDKKVYIDILYPNKTIDFNDLNNNSIIAKLNYNNFSMLFTGDIEEKAENVILEKYDSKVLKSCIIKIAHHGSKGSSSIEFLEAVMPKLALIGVGKNNSYRTPK